MTVAQMRDHIAKVYDGPSWKERVYYHMPDSQVIAIYNNFLKRDIFRKKKLKTSPRESDYKQLNLFDDFGIRNGEKS